MHAKMLFAAAAAMAFVLAWVARADAGTLTVLHVFQSSTENRDHVVGLTFLRGKLYGTADGGGTVCQGQDIGYGIEFAVDAVNGRETIPHCFADPVGEGNSPDSPLTQATGLFYGATLYGGGNELGIVFGLSPADGSETVIHSFTGQDDGSHPYGKMVVSGGKLYGVTETVRAVKFGAAYEIDLATNILSNLHVFARGNTDAHNALGLTWFGGSLFGAGVTGGMHDEGALFRLDPSTGVESVIYDFHTRNLVGGTPSTDLVPNGNFLYGATSFSEPANAGTIYRLNPRTGTVSPVYVFQDGPDGKSPASLIAWNGLLYGSTVFGGDGGVGSIFRLDPKTGVKTIVYSFDNAIGQSVEPRVLLVRAGVIYGTFDVPQNAPPGGIDQAVFRLDP